MRLIRTSTYKIPAPDRPKVYYEFAVTGIGDFPLDMLRYDACWPSTSVARMDQEGERTIFLASYSKPTPERWNSFGWRVSP